MHKAFYRIFAMTITIILILCLCAPCFAIGMVFDLANLGQLMWDAYASSHGIGVYYTSSGIHNSYDDSFSVSTFQAAWNDLYDRYKAFAGFTQSASAWAAEQIANVTIFQTPVDGTNQQYVGFEMDTPLVEWFDGFTTWLLGEELDIPSDSGTYHTSGTFGTNNTIYSLGTSGVGLLPVNVNASDWTTSPYVAVDVRYGKNYDFYYYDSNEPDIYGFVYNGSIYLCSANQGYFTVWYLVGSVGPVTSTQGYISTYNDSYNFYYYIDNYNNMLSTTFPVFSSLDSGFAAVAGYMEDPNVGTSQVVLAPKEKIRNGNGDIYIPSPLDTGYVPEKITKPTNIPWDNTYESNPGLALNAMQEAVRANNDILELTNSLTPTPVTSPFVPFDLPSFNFNFSGIWHYVVSWIGSIRSGYSFIFSVWNNIPFAMTIPIYATAVVCIVVGVFRKVF